MYICRFRFQAFTVVAVFNSMTFALKVTPLAVRALSEGAVAVKRFQVRIIIRMLAYTSPKQNIAVCFLFAIQFMAVHTSQLLSN